MNKDVQKHILLKYVNKCRELHSIAFLQWRLMFPSKYVNKEDSEELILSRIHNLISNMNLSQKPTDATIKATKISGKFLDKAYRYKLKEDKQ